jgi:predicted nucleic-acid-binding protein
MIGIDTNVLLRLLVRDLDTQVRAAEKLIATHCSSEEPGYVSRVVIIEIVWALKGFYGYDRSQIAASIRALLNVSELEVESADEKRRTVLAWSKPDPRCNNKRHYFLIAATNANWGDMCNFLTVHLSMMCYSTCLCNSSMCCADLHPWQDRERRLDVARYLVICSLMYLML